MMKIAVVCANGKEGKLIVQEAMDRGLDVTAVVRGENKSAAKKVISKDLFDLTASDLAGFDAVVDAFGAWAPELLPQHSTSLKHLCDLLGGTETRLLVCQPGAHDAGDGWAGFSGNVQTAGLQYGQGAG